MVVLFLMLAAGCDLTITPSTGQPEPEGLSLFVTAADITVGGRFALSYPAMEGDIEWVSSNDTIASASDGVAVGVSVGKAVISASDGRSMMSSSINIKPTVLGKRTTLSDAVIAVGDTLTFKAIAPSSAQITWSNDEARAVSLTKSKDGREATLNAVGVGAAVITAETEEERLSCSILVINPDRGSGEDIGMPELPLQLIWSDEFDGDGLDESKWEYQLGVQDVYVNGTTSTGPKYWGNNEQQYYTKEAVTVSDGTLKITAERKDNLPEGRKYTSARISTRDRGYWTYGYFEARMKLPLGTGMWPAFWMLPQPEPGLGTKNKYGGWAANGEIDIMEAKGRLPYESSGTLHYGRSGSSSYNYGNYEHEEPINAWHVYGFEWRAEYMAWYVDGVRFFTMKNTSWWSDSEAGKDNPYAPFDVPFYLLLNLAVGGNFDGGKQPDASFTSAVMTVDYVRVYA